VTVAHASVVAQGGCVACGAAARPLTYSSLVTEGLMDQRVPSGVLDLGDVPRMASVLQGKMEQFRRLETEYRRERYRLTQRLFDEERPAGKRTYIHASQGIETAWENYSAVFGLLQGRHGATPVAPYNLIRPAFEAAFYALWALEPEDGSERCLRGLRLAVEDNRQRGLWKKELMKIPDLPEEERERFWGPVAKASTVYRQEAEALRVKWPKVTERVNVLEAIPKLQHIVDLADPLILHTTVAAWRQLSGFQHGHVYAIVGGSDVSREFEIPGGALVRVTIKDQDFTLAMQHAGLMQLWALETYIARTITQFS
jgi:hypothetical protein